MYYFYKNFVNGFRIAVTKLNPSRQWTPLSVHLLIKGTVAWWKVTIYCLSGVVVRPSQADLRNIGRQYPPDLDERYIYVGQCCNSRSYSGIASINITIGLWGNSQSNSGIAPTVLSFVRGLYSSRRDPRSDS
jgi:hypothetical protein